jgi:ComF family protein
MATANSPIYNTINTTMHMLEQLLAIIAPHECLGCSREGLPLCEDCQRRLPGIVPHCYLCGGNTEHFNICAACQDQTPLHRLAQVTPYEGYAKALVYDMKFERKKAAAVPIAHSLARTLQGTSDDITVITHIPTATNRVRVRGYDQAEQIARELAHVLAVPQASLLLRVGQQRQVGQSRTVRRQQLKQAFACRPSADIAEKHILLVDDVITTGSTLEAAAAVLKTAGARRVSAAVFAVA